jgi:predicted Zn-dependent peptidase
MDNQPYGNLLTAILNNLFTNHPYHWPTIGSMEDLNAAKLDEFLDFYKKYYVPNNATLVVAGDLKPEQTKKWIEEYYGSIPKGEVFPKISLKTLLFLKKKKLLLQTLTYNFRLTYLHIELLLIKKKMLMLCKCFLLTLATENRLFFTKN